ncbi:threonine synthase [Thermomonas sp.]|uniref:threonine synthase n=1 Tax=Thermomonas sp. TaxID=1971895 RepID=UPI001B3F8B9C|nr:threonine synthase [Thermomonas sp.]MBP7788115.1 threonine synthase [Thermomonas sp.]MBP8615599.1 threonine synthase [Thermomonas sp.]
MRMLSTRGIAPAASISDAIAAGLAPDGGLYMPASLPSFTPADFDGADTLAQVAQRLLRPFFAGDALEGELAAICATAFAVEPPLRVFGEANDYILELFHGATAAFKDYGASFLAAALAALPRGDRPLTILVATSGDTGAAVGAAFHHKPGVRVAILYPDGRVSPRQAHQLGCFGDNVRAFRVDGSFDDCQKLVKTLLSDAAFKQDVPLGSANSISLGRLLPQMAYYAHAALGHWRAGGNPLNFVVPTGNLGNALACFLARSMGLPIGRLVLANNANDVLARFFEGGDYAPQASRTTLANAMDVGAPSNFERLQWLEPDAARLRAELSAESVSDDEIRATIVDAFQRHGEIVCPHTACAVRVLQRLRARGAVGDWAVVATAHPAKFPEVVEPLIGREVPLPAALAAMLARPSHAQPLAGDARALGDLLRVP